MGCVGVGARVGDRDFRCQGAGLRGQAFGPLHAGGHQRWTSRGVAAPGRTIFPRRTRGVRCDLPSAGKIRVPPGRAGGIGSGRVRTSRDLWRTGRHGRPTWRCQSRGAGHGRKPLSALFALSQGGGSIRAGRFLARVGMETGLAFLGEGWGSTDEAARMTPLCVIVRACGQATRSTLGASSVR